MLADAYFHLECGARIHKLRVYEKMLPTPNIDLSKIPERPF